MIPMDQAPLITTMEKTSKEMQGKGSPLDQVHLDHVFSIYTVF